MPFRFVHTADIHLDSPLKSLAMRDPELAALVQTATRQTFQNVITLCLEENVDALLIAGDLYDGDQTSMKTAAFLGAELRKLTDAGIRVCLIRGNHDAQSNITKRLSLPELAHQFPAKGGRLAFQSRDGEAVVIHGVSFDKPHEMESLLPLYSPPEADAINVGMMHASLDGALGHDPYAPVSTPALIAHGYDYWALGHIHIRMATSDIPAVVMPGIPQGRHVNESGPKSVTLAEISDDGSVDLAERRVSVVEFQRLDVAAPNAETVEDARAVIAEALQSARAACSSGHLAIRAQLLCGADAFWRLRREAVLLQNQVEDLVQTIDGLWLEQLEIAPEVAALPPASWADLHSEMLAALDAPALQAAASAKADELLKPFPAMLRGLLGETEAEEAEILRTLGEEGVIEVFARLTREEAAD